METIKSGDYVVTNYTDDPNVYKIDYITDSGYAAVTSAESGYGYMRIPIEQCRKVNLDEVMKLNEKMNKEAAPIKQFRIGDIVMLETSLAFWKVINILDNGSTLLLSKEIEPSSTMDPRLQTVDAYSCTFVMNTVMTLDEALEFARQSGKSITPVYYTTDEYQFYLEDNKLVCQHLEAMPKRANLSYHSNKNASWKEYTGKFKQFREARIVELTRLSNLYDKHRDFILEIEEFKRLAKKFGYPQEIIDIRNGK